MKRLALLFGGSVIILTLFGLFMIYDASSYVSFRDFADKYHYIKDQIFWAVLGFTAFGFFSFFDYKRLYYFSLPILLISILLLIMVFLPGIGVYLLGAHRWLDFKFFLLQPSELVKLGLSIFLAAWFSNREKGRLSAFLLLLGLVLLLVIMEPDMGTAAIILGISVVIYFLSGAPSWQFAAIIPTFGILGFLAAKLEPYRAQRLTTFFNVNSSPQNYSYHVRQILIALGSGGLFGVGFGNSLQKYAYLPENTTDSIFAIIAEETGFVGALVLVGVYAVLIMTGFRIASKTKDNFGKLLAAGITTTIAMQTIINLASQTALLPLTGIPLPFISYGGSALIINLASAGILVNIARQNK